MEDRKPEKKTPEPVVHINTVLLHFIPQRKYTVKY